jgi:hypothetical protein
VLKLLEDLVAASPRKPGRQLQQQFAIAFLAIEAAVGPLDWLRWALEMRVWPSRAELVGGSPVGLLLHLCVQPDGHPHIRVAKALLGCLHVHTEAD